MIFSGLISSRGHKKKRGQFCNHRLTLASTPIQSNAQKCPHNKCERWALLEELYNKIVEV